MAKFYWSWRTWSRDPPPGPHQTHYSTPRRRYHRYLSGTFNRTFSGTYSTPAQDPAIAGRSVVALVCQAFSRVCIKGCQ